MPAITIPGQIIPDKLLVTLPFVWQSVIEGTSYDYDYIQTSANDPAHTGVGAGQPLGHDQWTTFYNYARVYAITGKVKVVNTSTKAWAVSLNNQRTSTAPSLFGPNGQWAQPGTKPRLIGVSAGGHDMVTLPVKHSAKKTLGMTTEQYMTPFSTTCVASGDTTSAPVNPQLLSYLLFQGETLDGAAPSAGTGLSLIWDLEFHIEYFGRDLIADTTGGLVPTGTDT